MTQYFYTIPILFMTILCMLFLTATNQYIAIPHKKGFFVAFLGELFIILFELMSIFLNGSAGVLKLPHFLSNYLGFLLSPILVAFFAASIGEFYRFKGAIIGICVYFVLFNVLVITGQLFFIDAQNTYHRGSMFFVYVIAYILAVAYLLYETLQYSMKGFLQHKAFAYLLSLCFLVSCCFQTFKPDIYTTRIAVVLNLCLYYAYNIELTDLFDKLTGILNQRTYLKKVEELKAEQVVIILDVDDFKQINDNYGHLFGDKCLKIVAQAIKATFENYGQCYRIGGDEFAVILRNHRKIERLTAQFEKTAADKTKHLPCRLSVSYGYSKCEKNDSFDAVVQRADHNMYNAKNQKKALKYK